MNTQKDNKLSKVSGYTLGKTLSFLLFVWTIHQSQFLRPFLDCQKYAKMVIYIVLMTKRARYSNVFIAKHKRCYMKCIIKN